MTLDWDDIICLIRLLVRKIKLGIEQLYEAVVQFFADKRRKSRHRRSSDDDDDDSDEEMSDSSNVLLAAEAYKRAVHAGVLENIMYTTDRVHDNADIPSLPSRLSTIPEGSYGTFAAESTNESIQVCSPSSSSDHTDFGPIDHVSDVSDDTYDLVSDTDIP